MTADIEDIYPLSPMQQGLLFHTLYAPEETAYFIQVVRHLEGKLEAEAFHRAWEEVVARHQVLRTAFLWKRGKQPCQVVHRSVALPWEEHDWRGLPAAEQSQALAAFLQASRARGFDLAQAPLLRLALIRVGEEDYRLVSNHHHLLLDGWCLPILLGEVFAFYEAIRRGETLHLPKARPYGDYIAWLQGCDLAEAEGFWRTSLQGFRAPTPLAIEQASRDVSGEGPSFQEQERWFSAELTEDLRAWAQSQRVTLNTLVQGAWALVLSRYSGARDVLFGATVSGRPPELAGVESMIGIFINTLPVRVSLDPRQGVGPWLRDIQAQRTRERQYEYTPLSQLQGWSEVPRGTSLFESILVFENYPVDTSSAPERSPEVRITDERWLEWTNYPLTLVAMARREMALRANYDTRRFDEAAIGRLLEHVEMALRGFISSADRALGEVSILTEAERRRLETPVEPFSTDEALPDLVTQLEAQVRRTPDAVAVSFGDQALTYAELNRRANRVAHRLRALGVGPDVAVALCVERSLEMVVGILGILKAGGAYVPLDPSSPDDRLAFMLADIGSSVLVTQAALAAKLGALGTPLLLVDDDATSRAGESDHNPDVAVSAASACYVIYTSGSTGKPKGVVVSRENVARLFRATDAWFRFSEKDVWTLFHSDAFDFSVWELWGALLYGGRLVVVSWEVSRSPEAFYDLLVRERVTVLNQTPSAFRQLMAADESLGPKPLALQWVIFGGEALELQSLRPWFARHGDQVPTLVNMYGITETTVHVTYRPLRVHDLETASSVIGCAIPDLQVQVLDADRRPVPLGVPGEMYVGGAGVARGYLNRADLTAERFIPDPTPGPPGRRLYRTGDLARYRGNGDLEYLGRIDHQVKIRGFRIELGEIEAALGSHPLVRESAVLMREEPSGERRLVGYFATRSGEEIAVDALRQHLKKTLPEYMVPAAYVKLARLPLTPNGKLDRDALPSPGASRPELSQEFAAPQTPEEQVLASIWALVLGVERVGIHDNFFDLGGDSIRSIQVLARAQEKGFRFSLARLFEHPTVHALARGLEATSGPAPAAPTRPFALLSPEDEARLPAGVVDAYPLAALQAGMLFHSAYRADDNAYHNITSYILKAPFDRAALDAAVRGLVERHEILRTSFALTGYSEPLQLVHASVRPPVSVDDLRALSAAERDARRARWIEEERGRRFQWTEAPLFRIHVYLLDHETFQLTLTEHHSILDGWSVATLLSEFFGTYFALARGQRVPTARAPEMVYREFVALERESMRSEESRTFWSRTLTDLRSARLPRGDGSDAPPAGRRVQRDDVSLDPPVADGLRRLARAAGVPLKNVLLAAHLKVMAVLAGSDDVLTGVVANGRPEGPDGERVLGLFLNTLPFRMRLSAGSWVDLVRRVFAAEREMLPHRRYPLAALAPSGGREPLFETAFNFVHFHIYQGVVGLSGVQLLSAHTQQDTNFPLAANFRVNAAAGDVQLSLDWDSAVLRRDQMDLIRGYYTRVLARMAGDPAARHDAADLLSEEERQRVLVEPNDTRREYPADRTVPDLFRAHVQATPRAVAVELGDESLTYAELDQRSNQLARYLRARGVRPETRVAISMERSLDLVVGLLGIVKAGGAYLPLDPSYPLDRLAYMVEDAGVPLLLLGDGAPEGLESRAPRVVHLSRERAALAREKEEAGDLTPGLHPENAAYVIYTSGSTGRPKGSILTHRGVANLQAAQALAFQLKPGTRVLQFSSLSFDASVFEMVMALLSGGTLCLATREALRPGPGLGDLLRARAIENATIPPSVLATVPAQSLPRLQTLVVAGEACPRELVARWAVEGRRFFNAYGPTETTIWATVAECGGGASRPPIGRPIANVRTYVLGPDGRPVAVGVAGELYIGGPGLARGYVGRPDLTAEKFVPDPFSASGGARLYRTGDLVRLKADGHLEYLGRIDAQVKMRGFRIELGEIEAVLGAHTSVREAAVARREDRPGEERLVAYVVAEGEPSVAALRSYLQSRLPDHMIPSAFVFLGALPLTPSGKIDRRALPEPERQQAGASRVAPRTELEKTLAGLWAECLGYQEVGIEDNFFELGGHSLVALRLAARIHETLGIAAPIEYVYDAPTIAELAVRLVQQQAELADAGLVARLLAEMEG